eukprot:Blabericola_migrator_1__12546@NODE_797_length_6473_cov_6_762722_g565_i0_p3_GENE_NODE_797_length_6473_cov_6_762722_g565_i0NODE_797_length_6473_cov_6_762722_g565_i0_p3_ORF_typecomplete_len488_score80_27_NODE_797_length_6473_cov_6_762722_g565_i031214584
MSIGLCFLTFAQFLHLRHEAFTSVVQIVGDSGSSETADDFLEIPLRRLLLFLDVSDLCHLERVSRLTCMAVRYYGYDTYALSLYRTLPLEQERWKEAALKAFESSSQKPVLREGEGKGKASQALDQDEQEAIDLCNVAWRTNFGLKYHLILLKMAQLCVCQTEGTIERLKLEEELRNIREVCEFLKEQKSVDKFSDPKTIDMLNAVLTLSSGRNTELCFTRDERSALTCLRIGLGKLMGTELPSDIHNAAEIAKLLGEPYENPKRFFHTLLTELGKFVNGLRRVQKESIRLYREVLFWRNICTGCLMHTKRSLSTVFDLAVTRKLDSEPFAVDIGRMTMIEHPKAACSLFHFEPFEKALITRMNQRKLQGLPQLAPPHMPMMPPMMPYNMMLGQPPPLDFGQPMSRMSSLDQTKADGDFGNEQTLTNQYARQNTGMAKYIQYMRQPDTNRVGPYSIKQENSVSQAPTLHQKLSAGSYTYFEPRPGLG